MARVEAARVWGGQLLVLCLKPNRVTTRMMAKLQVRHANENTADNVPRRIALPKWNFTLRGARNQPLPIRAGIT